MKTFGELIASSPTSVHDVEGRADVSGVQSDSRLVKPGDMFFCVPSSSRDTHDFLADVGKAGAVAALAHSPEGAAHARKLGLASAWVEPDAFLETAGLLAREALGDPTRSMRVVGVTGTNGKTTTVWMVKHALDTLGEPCAYVGTLGFYAGSERRELPNTSPFPVEMWRLLAEARDLGCRAIALEASSHALFERRLAGVRFDVGAFTNLTQDHLDFHGTMENYAAAKRLLFDRYATESEKPFVGVLNQADPYGDAWSKEFDHAFTFGRRGSDLVVEPLRLGAGSLALRAEHGGRTCEFDLRFGGTFNVENATAALGCLLSLGFDLDVACRALAQVPPVPGRVEPIPNDFGFTVLVDYAHTPDAVRNLVKSARDLEPRKLITVFGCGGDRDRTKRPLMAEAASELSDLTVVTSDNPRTEDPERIVADIVPGLAKDCESVVVVDRREAIFEAVRRAEQGDIVLIAGKGHEDYQVIGKVKHPMDDREMVREALEARK